MTCESTPGAKAARLQGNRPFVILLAALLIACQNGKEHKVEPRVASASAASATAPPPSMAQPSPKLYAGGAQTCAVTNGGVLKCWGRDYREGIVGETLRPKVVTTGVRELAVGGTSLCALQMNGTVACWGWHSDGAIGVPADGLCRNGLKVEEPCVKTPAVLKDLPPAVAIDASPFHTCIISDQNQVYCWGDNFRGQLGRRTSERCGQHPWDRCSRAPLHVPGLDQVTQLALGVHISCALRADGTVWCWGANENGQLGRGSPNADGQTSPAPVRLPTKAVQIEAGSKHVCAVSAEHQVFCWGGNESRQLGAATSEGGDCPFSSTPLAVAGLPPVASLSIHYASTCALGQDGSLWCWGSNVLRGTGLRDSETCKSKCMGHDEADACVPSPARVTDIPALSKVANGGDHVCGIADGRVVCWGAYSEGQLGFEPKHCASAARYDCIEPWGIVDL